MANALYGLGRQAFLDGDIDWAANDIRLILGDAADYTVSIDTHDFLDDVAAGSRVSTSGAFSGKSSTLGVADATDVTLTSVTGDPSEWIIIYQHTGTEGTARLICYIDTATGLPVTPNGANINIVFDNGANKIFKL